MGEDDRGDAGEVLIVTGMSGAGRSTVANALEDLGWYVVDNLPPQLLPTLLDITGRAGGAMPRVAAVVDVRGRDLVTDLPKAMAALQETHANLRVVFLDAADAVLVRRFEAVRRPHPLQEDGTLLDGIRRERQRLSGVRDAADVVIDSSDVNIHQLAGIVADLFREESSARHSLAIVSFGFKYGVPPDADLLIDMRFLPNPYWNEELRGRTGEDPEVREFVLSQPGAGEFLDAYVAALAPVIAGYQQENKRHSVLAVGCTGGKHRSVATAGELRRRLSGLPGLGIRVVHRDLGRE